MLWIQPMLMHPLLEARTCDRLFVLGLLCLILLGASSATAADQTGAKPHPLSPDVLADNGIYSEDKLFECIPVLRFKSQELAKIVANAAPLLTPEQMIQRKEVINQYQTDGLLFEGLAQRKNPQRLKAVLAQNDFKNFDSSKNTSLIARCKGRVAAWQRTGVFKDDLPVKKLAR